MSAEPAPAQDRRAARRRALYERRRYEFIGQGLLSIGAGAAVTMCVPPVGRIFSGVGGTGDGVLICLSAVALVFSGGLDVRFVPR